jgi:hypothetical protein
MSTDPNNNKPVKDEKADTPIQPDPETLHKTDPQSNMEGPVSSLMNNVKEGFNSDETKEEADEKKEKNM